MASFLVIHLSGALGGGEQLSHYVIKSLSEHDQDVELLTFEFDKKIYKNIIGEDLPEGITIHTLPFLSIKPPFSVYKRFFLYRKSLKVFIENYKKRCDFIFLSNASYPVELDLLINIHSKVVGYVHFPEIHYSYEKSNFIRRLYLQPLKHHLQNCVGKIDSIICNSYYTRNMVVRYWRNFIKRVEVIYPPVDLRSFWCNKSIDERENRVIYVGRFIPAKGHEIMKKLARRFPNIEFVSVGTLTNETKGWFNNFNKDIPKNYSLKPNLPKNELKKLLQDSKYYVHLMKGEHFGIAPIEALASGCITFVPEISGVREFIPKKFRWESEADLEMKISKMLKVDESWWCCYRELLWQRIKELDVKVFSKKLWRFLKETYSYLL